MVLVIMRSSNSENKTGFDRTLIFYVISNSQKFGVYSKKYHITDSQTSIKGYLNLTNV